MSDFKSDENQPDEKPKNLNEEVEKLINERLTIYKYNSKYWDKKYLSLDLLSTNYEAKLVTNKLSFGLYHFHFFKDNFCNELVSDLKKFEGWTKNRHENFPTNDVLLKEYNSNLYDIYTNCLKNIVLPIINKVYDGSTYKAKKLEHETFIIRYKPELQNSLNLHHDASEFSVILNLSKEGEDFEGGGTYFPQHELLLKAPKGHLVMHPGRMTHYHGVRPITSGERYVIVSFCNFNRS